ncbi:putative mitochondrial carrier domain superfamily [Helianthus debilis subsp. tardiflorus]
MGHGHWRSLVRGRLTVQTDKSSSQYRGIAHALRTVLREEGPRALYKGWLPSVIGVAVAKLEIFFTPGGVGVENVYTQKIL